MTFRDDNNALRAQIETLQRELQDKEAQHAAERTALEERIGQLKSRLSPQAAPTRRHFAILAAGVLAVVVVGVYLLTRPAPPRPRAETTASTTPGADARVSDPLTLGEVEALKSTADDRAIGLAALSVAAHRAGQAQRAQRLVSAALAAAGQSSSSSDVTRALAVVVCAQGELGQKAHQAAVLREVGGRLAAGLSYEDEARTYGSAAELCLDLDAGGQTAPLLAAATIAAGKLGTEQQTTFLLEIADLQQRAGNVTALNEGATRLLKQHSPASMEGGKVRARLAIALWRAGERARARQLAMQAAEHGRDAEEVALAARAMATTGLRAEAQQHLVRARELIRATDTYHAAGARLDAAVAYLLLGERAQARAIVDASARWPRALLEAGRFDDLAQERILASPHSYAVALHLARTGQAERALKRARECSELPFMHAYAPAIVYAILAGRRQPAADAAAR